MSTIPGAFEAEMVIVREIRIMPGHLHAVLMSPVHITVLTVAVGVTAVLLIVVIIWLVVLHATVTGLNGALARLNELQPRSRDAATQTEAIVPIITVTAPEQATESIQTNGEATTTALSPQTAQQTRLRSKTVRKINEHLQPRQQTEARAFHDSATKGQSKPPRAAPKPVAGPIAPAPVSENNPSSATDAKAPILRQKAPAKSTTGTETPASRPKAALRQPTARLRFTEPPPSQTMSSKHESTPGKQPQANDPSPAKSDSSITSSGEILIGHFPETPIRRSGVGNVQQTPIKARSSTGNTLVDATSSPLTSQERLGKIEDAGGNVPAGPPQMKNFAFRAERDLSLWNSEGITTTEQLRTGSDANSRGWETEVPAPIEHAQTRPADADLNLWELEDSTSDQGQPSKSAGKTVVRYNKLSDSAPVSKPSNDEEKDDPISPLKLPIPACDPRVPDLADPFISVGNAPAALTTPSAEAQALVYYTQHRPYEPWRVSTAPNVSFAALAPPPGLSIPEDIQLARNLAAQSEVIPMTSPVELDKSTGGTLHRTQKSTALSKAFEIQGVPQTTTSDEHDNGRLMMKSSHGVVVRSKQAGQQQSGTEHHETSKQHLSDDCDARSDSAMSISDSEPAVKEYEKDDAQLTSSKTNNTAKVMRLERKSARDALNDAWHARETLRAKLVGGYTLERAMALEQITKHYNRKRSELSSLMVSGQLNDEDAEMYPLFSVKDTRKPKVHVKKRDASAQTSASKAPEQATTSEDKDDQSEDTNTTIQAQPATVDHNLAKEVFEKAKNACRFYEQACEVVDNICSVCLCAACDNSGPAIKVTKAKRTMAYYTRVRGMLVDAYGGSLPVEVEDELPVPKTC